MTNTTAAALIATAAATVTNRDEYTAFWANPAHVTAFVATQIKGDLLASAQNDFYDAMYVADLVADITKIEAMTDTELAAREAAALAEDGWNTVEGKFEVYYLGAAQADLGTIAALREFRAHQAAVAAWSVAPVAHLTHSPFAALAV